MGMIPTRNKGTTTGSHIPKYTSCRIQDKHSRVYQDSKGVVGLITKLVSSTIELWTPTPDLAWILKRLHNQHKETPPSLPDSPLGYASPSSALQGVQIKKPTPLDLSVRFLPTLALSS